MKLLPMILMAFFLILIAGQCPQECLHCHKSQSKCSACSQGYQLTIAGGCVAESRVPNCAIYDQLNNCLLCSPTFQLQNSICVKVYSGCMLHEGNTDNCLQCGFGHVLKGGKCLGVVNCRSGNEVCFQCEDGFELVDGRCIDVSGNCQSKTQEGICERCKDGYKLVGYQCVTSDLRIFGCNIYLSNGECISCKRGYQLYQGYCLLQQWIERIRKGESTLDYILIENNISQFKMIARILDASMDNSIQLNNTNNHQNPQQHLDQGKQQPNNSIKLSQSNFDYSGLVLVNPANNQIFSHTTPSDQSLNSQQSYQQPNSQGGIVVLDKSKSHKWRNRTSRHRNTPINTTIPNCAIADSSNNGRCATCNPSFTNTAIGCIIVTYNCQTYNITTGFCQLCLNNFLLQKNTCVDPNCAIWNGQVCSSCSDGYYLHYNICTVIPVLNCQRADGQGSCLACKNGFILLKGNCIINPQPVSNCQSYSLLTGTCVACFPGYTLINNACFISSSNNSSQQNNTSHDQNCAKFHQNGTCSQCYQSFYYQTKDKLCLPVNSQCKTYNSQTGLCLSCYQGYVLNNGACIIDTGLTSADPNCKATSQGKCIQCYSGFYFSIVNQKCIPANALCKTWNNTDGSCLSCYSGYFLNGQTCSLASNTPTGDPNCNKFATNGACVQCATKYYSSNGLCRQVNPQCKTYDPANGNCISCYQGYTLSSGNCQVSSSGVTVDANCKTFSGLICLQCYIGYYLNESGKCALSNPLCKTVISPSGQCSSCYPGYILTGGNCLVSTGATSPNNPNDPNCRRANEGGVCTACYQGYYLTDSNTCHVVNNQCKTFTVDFRACTSCYQGYTLTKGDCLVSTLQPSNTDPYCIKTQNGACMSCAGGYYLSSKGTCLLANPLCKTVDSNGSCTSCYQGYSLSSHTCVITQNIEIPGCLAVTGTLCTSCSQGYFLFKGICQLLDPLCAKYNVTSGACLSCITGYIYSSGNCVYSEPSKDPNCLAYSGTYCIKCVSGYLVQNFACVQVDPKCICLDPTGSVCMKCKDELTPLGLRCI